VARPDLVVYFGGQLVSKKIKQFLRHLEGAKFYAISPDAQIVDTFQNVNVIIQADPEAVLKDIRLQQKEEKSGFKEFWEKELKKANEVKTKFSKKTGFSDFKTFERLSGDLPGNAFVFAGNSTVVRYLSYFDQKNRHFFSNRGTSGIDGCLSSAAGLASKVTESVYAIVGDLSFVYDSNAFWNRSLPKNLKIILINNQGGGIFHLLKGPSDDKAFVSMVNAHHPVDYKKLSEAYGMSYALCDSENSLVPLITELESKKGKAEVLEIATPNHGEPELTKEFFRLLNKK